MKSPKPLLNTGAQFLDKLKTSSGAIDLKKLIFQTGFSIYSLSSQARAFHLWAINVGYREHQITEVSLVFVSPNLVTPKRVVTISTINRTLYPEQIFHEATLLPVIKRALIGYLPPVNSSSFVQRDQVYREHEIERLWHEYFANDLDKVQPDKAPSHFKVAKWKQPVPFTLGYSDTEVVRIAVTQTGLIPGGLSPTLASLIILQANDAHLDTLEQEHLLAVETMLQGKGWAQ